MGFINDMIHLTRGEFVIKYWYLYVTFTIIVLCIYFADKKVKKQQNNNFVEDLLKDK